MSSGLGLRTLSASDLSEYIFICWLRAGRGLDDLSLVGHIGVQLFDFFAPGLIVVLIADY